MKRGMLVAGIAALALVGAAVWWWQQDARRQTTATAPAASPSHGRGGDQTKAESAPPTNAHPTHTEDDAHADGHDHGDEAPSVDLRARYFEPPTLRDARNFAGEDTPLLVEASCRAHPLLRASGSAEQRLRSLYALDSRTRFPEEVFYRSLIQFWQQDGQYYQLSAIWDIGLPPMYTLKLHRSPTPRFDGAVSEEPLPESDGHSLDAAAAAAAMAQITDARAAQGARLGLQMMEADWPDADGRGRMRATLANGRPESWSFPGGACRYDNTAKAMRCRCPSAREREAPGTS
jgi:hypothetical protein